MPQPQGHPGRDRVPPLGQARQGLHGQGALLQAARLDRPQGRLRRFPPGVDYNLWLGPAPERPFNPNRFHYNWHWFWDYGNGDLGNQGIHQMDLARWGLGKNEFPKAVLASGGRFGYTRRRPDAQHPARRLRVRRLRASVRGPRPLTNDELKVKIGDIFYGTEGILAITSYTDWQVYFGPKLEKGPGGRGGGDHFANFVKAVRARDHKLLNADIEAGPPLAAPTATWATSPTAWAASCTSTPRPSRS